MLPTAVDRWHAQAVRSRWLLVFTAVTRVLLALAFIPSGLTKVAGHRFTIAPITTPGGYFFDGFFSALGYYRFVGIAQLVAAALLLLPSTAALGAVVYFPIIVNIFVITVALGFDGTPFVAGAMLLANIYLLCWDYDRWKDLLPHAPGHRHLGLTPTLGLAGAALLGLYGVFRLHRAWLKHTAMTPPALVVVSAGIVAAVIVWRSVYRNKV